MKTQATIGMVMLVALETSRNKTIIEYESPVSEVVIAAEANKRGNTFTFESATAK